KQHLPVYGLKHSTSIESAQMTTFLISAAIPSLQQQLHRQSPTNSESTSSRVLLPSTAPYAGSRLWSGNLLLCKPPRISCQPNGVDAVHPFSSFMAGEESLFSDRGSSMASIVTNPSTRSRF